MNIADRLRAAAAAWPDRAAVIVPQRRGNGRGYAYRERTFRELNAESDRLAAGLAAMGVRPGTKLVLFVPFGWEFIALTFALFKAGAIVVLIDPGMGRANIFECLREVQPDGFAAIPLVHLVRIWKRRDFSRARLNVTVGRRWGWGGRTYRQLLADGGAAAPPAATVQGTDPAAIIFTSGSTGPPKGVLYEHGMFNAQVDMIRDFYGIEPGEIDLPGFPLFGLFNAAMGVTTVIPDMDPTRPAQVDPERIITIMRDCRVTQAFGSPAFWNRIGRYCEEHGVTLPTIRRGLSAGGPVPLHVLRRMHQALTGPGAELHTPYGATESLPVTSIGAREVLEQTAERTAGGAGTCVGRPFPGVEVRIIAVTAGPVASLEEVPRLPVGEIGEIIVRSPAVTREYFQRPDATRLAKIPVPSDLAPQERDPPLPAPCYHRIGDVGYWDAEGRLWFCGRKSHIVQTAAGPMYSVCCEAIFDEHPEVYRAALVGVGPPPRQRPVIVIEPEEGRFPSSRAAEDRLRTELLSLAQAHPVTAAIRTLLFHPSLPVDTRHNVKINREALAVWAAARLSVDDPAALS